MFGEFCLLKCDFYCEGQIQREVLLKKKEKLSCKFYTGRILIFENIIPF